jgi:hypothetical protein
MTDAKAETNLSQSAPTSEDHPYVRLHVTPLDAELLKVVLSSALLPKARNISYHAIETFPEKRYGFLELPSEDAEKLRKKLNGAVLKGVKIRIERARPSRIPTPLAQAAMAKEKTSKRSTEGAAPPKDKSKKRKRGAEELSGVVLEDGRTIKRGWTSAEEPKEKRSKKGKEKEGKEKKKQSKSKYTDHAECLVKTILPANAAPLLDADHAPATKRKKKGKTSREVIVHEFERTTKFPTFLKSTAATGSPGAPLEFVEGKGWVNQDGDVVENVKPRPPPSAKVLLPSKSTDRDRETPPSDETATSSSDDEPAEESGPGVPAAARDSGLLPEVAGSNFSSPSTPPKPDSSRPRSSGSIRNLSITIPPATPNEPKVHPLEALYKRPKQSDDGTPEAAPGAQGFSFFADGNEESAEEDVGADASEASGSRVPLTPFTRQDLELRGIRSAAPTPDTAHPSRRFTPWELDNDRAEQHDAELTYQESEEDEHVPSHTMAAQAGESQGKPTSDFQQWFWNNRGDLNRSWKKRNKLARKEKRYRENKARMARAI